MIDALLTLVATVTALLIVYHHVGYPIILRYLAKSRGQDLPAPAPVPANDLPSIRLIVPAYNEAGVMANKIANLRALDYPADKLSVLIALDGCTDETAQVARAALARQSGSTISRDNVAMIEFTVNRGKVAVLNELIEQSNADLIALSDVSAMLAPDALLKAAAHFQNAKNGVVCGTYQIQTAGSEGERAYWDYQTKLKAAEAAVAAPMGAHGAFYVFRRRLWTRLPADTINDDFVLPMRIVGAGYGAVYDRAIVAMELERTQSEQEFKRRVRIGAGNMQQLVRMPQLLSPRQGWVAFVYGSGKALRPLIPFLAVAFAVAALALWWRGSEVFGWLLAGGLAAAAAALFASYSRNPNLPKPLLWLGYLFEGHAASAVGALQFLSGRTIGNWQPTAQSQVEADKNWTYLSPAVSVSKRVFDIVLGLGILAVFLVLLPFIALAIWWFDPGPVFYRQLRVGRSTPHATELFELIKFRSMYTDAEKFGAKWATKDDPRITPIGRFLRKSRLDELPQCINVLKGEMSIIGPRPERPSYFTKLEAEIPFYIERTYGVRPGITGLAQVHLPYDETIEDVRLKCVYDHAYAARITTWLNWFKTDLEIVGRTFAVMAGRKGQ